MSVVGINSNKIKTIIADIDAAFSNVIKESVAYLKDESPIIQIFVLRRNVVAHQSSLSSFIDRGLMYGNDMGMFETLDIYRSENMKRRLPSEISRRRLRQGSSRVNKRLI